MNTAAARRSPADHCVVLGRAALTLLPEGAAWWPERRTLLVADLHLETGSSLARRGMMLPPHDTTATIARLEDLAGRLDPRRIISLGDAFHDCAGPMRMSAPVRTRLCDLMAGRDWIWIAGNHDPVFDPTLGGDRTTEVAEDGLVFRHHPTRGRAIGEVAGHLHPAAQVHLGAMSLKRHCFATDGRRMILPAFGAYTGGLSLRNPAFDGLFDPASLVVGLIGDDRVHLFPGRLAR